MGALKCKRKKTLLGLYKIKKEGSLLLIKQGYKKVLLEAP